VERFFTALEPLDNTPEVRIIKPCFKQFEFSGNEKLI